MKYQFVGWFKMARTGEFELADGLPQFNWMVKVPGKSGIKNFGKDDKPENIKRGILSVLLLEATIVLV